MSLRSLVGRSPTLRYWVLPALDLIKAVRFRVGQVGMRTHQIERTVLDTAGAAERLGWRAERTIEAGIEQTIEAGA